MMLRRIAQYGAGADAWNHFDLVLGLGPDLLPAVSNPNATISPDSAMKGIGKTPSRYNGNRQVVGFPNWTQYHATSGDITRWAQEADYGICLQARRVRFIDVDVDNAGEAGAIAAMLAPFNLPRRHRGNSSKFLVAFEMPGDFTKRRFKTAHGIVEFLATGQQAIVAGTHPSGARYEWEGGLPDAFPVLTSQEFEALWQALVDEFAIEAPVERSASVKAAKLGAVHENDPVARHLHETGMVKRVERDGRMHITCPWEDEHTSDSGDSSTTYWPAHTGGFEHGGFQCLHAHCEHRTVVDLREAIGLVEDVLDDFEAIGEEVEPPKAEDKPLRFAPIPAHEFAVATRLRWIIKGVLPQAELAVVYGESGSGKSFAVLDMAAAIARGVSWRGNKVHQGKVVYIAAEGANGFRNRLRAYAHQENVDLASVPLHVIHAAPNMMDKTDALDVSRAVLAVVGKPSLIVVDTLAQTMPGGNENAGEDMGKALAHCRGLHKATGALVLLVHHSGKDSSKGARGWSGLRAAADVEMEVVRAGEDRTIRVSKQKDGDDGAEFGFRLETVLVDLDDDGDDVTSCVVAHCAAVVKSGGAQGKNEARLFRIVLDLVGLNGEGPTEDEIKAAVLEQVPLGENAKRDLRWQNHRPALVKLVEKSVLTVKAGRYEPAKNDEYAENNT